jgi:hypothetical protein
VDNIFVDFSATGGPDLSQSVGAHIGLFDPTGLMNDDGAGGPGSKHESNFEWIDGDSSTFRNWFGNEPNNNGGEYYAAMFGPGSRTGRGASMLGQWNDIPNDVVLNGIAEVVPEPGCLALLAAGALLSVRRRGHRA